MPSAYHQVSLATWRAEALGKFGFAVRAGAVNFAYAESFAVCANEELKLSCSVASFFSGIGGLDFGVERAGFKLPFHCEIKPFCRDTLTAGKPSASAASATTRWAMPSPLRWRSGWVAAW